MQRHRPHSACKLVHCGAMNTTAPDSLADHENRHQQQQQGSTIVRENEYCETGLYPQGHWNRLAKADPDTRYWRSTGRRMMYGSIAAQHAIWRHQHPKTCRDKKFIVYKTSGNGNGVGSVLHKTTIVLQAALDLDRILVLYPQRHGQWIDGPFCAGFYTLDSCYFEPISSCSIRDAMRRKRWGDIPWLDSATYGANTDRVLRDDYLQSGAFFLIRSTPIMFHELLRAGNLSTAAYYWWRAQGAAYLVRPNARTLEELERRRVDIFENGTVEEGAVSVHVRHGDKWRESAIAADETYLQVAEALVRDHPEVKRSIFLSTEDANTVRFFSGLTNWTVRWTDVKRQDHFQGSTAEFANMLGWNEEFLNSLLSLQLALECDAWVGMISSNWNRLIDELRSTIRCKYDRPYVDVFAGENITDYDWR